MKSILITILVFTNFVTLAVFGVEIYALAAPCITRQELTAKGVGLVARILVEEGQFVKRGERVIEFDNRIIRAAVKEAEGAFEAAKANEDLALDADSRLKKLAPGEAVSEQQLVEARIRLTQARAVRKQAEGALDRMRAQLEDTVIKAELAGTVRGLPAAIGMAVQAGQSLGRIETSIGACAKGTKN